MSSWDPEWEKVFARQEWGKYPSEHLIRFVARNWYKVPDRGRVRLLDLGCGPGAATWFMAREGFSVSCIDCSATAIELLNRRLEREGLQAESVVADYTKLKWESETFDGVIDNASLYSNPFEQSRKVVREVWRVLKPGAWFFSSSFTNRCWGFGSGDEVEPGGFASISGGPCANTGFCRFMTRPQVESLYEEFAELSIETCSWTLAGCSKLMEMWLVTCRK